MSILVVILVLVAITTVVLALGWICNYECYTRPLDVYNEYMTKFNALETYLASLPRVELAVFPYPVYYINLDTATTRNEFMRSQFDYYGCGHNTNRVQAVDGRGSDAIVDLDGKAVVNRLRLSNRELACTLSHIRAIATAYRAGHAHAIILEDDAYFRHARLWKDDGVRGIVRRAPHGWNIVNLYSSTILCSDPPAYAKYAIGETECMLASSYVINRQGMRNILGHVSWHSQTIILDDEDKDVMSYHGADTMIFKWAGNSYFARPSTLFVHNDAKGMATSIQQSNDILNQHTNALFVLNQFPLPLLDPTTRHVVTQN